MAFFIRRLLVAPLLLINFVLYIAVAAIAGWALNLAIDEGWEGKIGHQNYDLNYNLFPSINFTLYIPVVT